jgi:hypothetical protein
MKFQGKRWTNTLALQKIAGKAIRRLELFDTSVDDDFLEAVAKLGMLTSIHISSQKISDRGIACVADHNPLVSLMLSNAPKVTDECMGAISGCKTIRELYRDGTSVSDDGIESVGRLPELWSLVIDNTSITDVGIERIASRTIHLISFRNCSITGNGFFTWSQSEKMSFFCTGSRLSDQGFAVACGSFSRMWNVDIADTDVGNDGIKSLAGQYPTMLRFNNCKIDRNGISWIIDNLPIESLEISPSQLSESDVRQLKKPRRLNVVVDEKEL